MATLSFSTSINAPMQKVWDILWDDTTYRKWTAAFMEGSRAVSDWNEGSRILFLGPGEDGMFSMIEKKDPPRQMVFKHLGEIKNGVEQTNKWENARESYHLSESNGVTELVVKLEMPPSPDMESYFNTTFPKALAILKQLAEEK